VGLVRQLIAVGIESAGRDAEEAAVVGFPNVDPPLPARGQDRHRTGRIGGDAENAREIVAAAAGEDSHHAVGLRQCAPDLADEAVAAHHDRNVALLRGLPGLRDPVLEALGANDAIGDRPALELALDLGQQLQRPPAGRMRVDQEKM
jgi:hypothetical protein